MGVVGEVVDGALGRNPDLHVYAPYTDFPDNALAGRTVGMARRLTVGLRAEGAPDGLASPARAAVASLDPMLAVSHVRTMMQVVNDASAPQRFSALLVTAFAAGALLLAGIGLYGVLAFTVSQRTREIGVRLALGSPRGDLLRLVIGHGMMLAAVGLVMGALGAVAAVRVLETQLFETRAYDPVTFLVVPAIGAGGVNRMRHAGATRVASGSDGGVASGVISNGYNHAIPMRTTVFLVLLLCTSSPVLSGQSAARDPLAREIFQELIEINTTDTPLGNTTKAAEAMAARLRAAGFPAGDVRVLGPDPRKGNLVARFRGKGAGKPILLLAHLDVVEAKREDWSVDPFTFIEKDGYFYGRGTTDDKGMAAQFVANLIRLKREGFVPDRDLILALTADEEGGSFNGVQWLLKNHRDLIDAEFAINEGGGGSMRGGKYLTNEIQASEKVYQDFRLEVKNPGGHSSLPVKENAINRLAAGLTRLAAFEFPVALNEVTRTYFERSAAVETDAKVAADMRAVARSSPDLTAAARLASAQPYFNAMMRTTCIATLLEAGHAPNALPQLARANVNCRILPGVSPASISAKIVEVLKDPQISVSFVGEATPSKPSPLRKDVLDVVEALTKKFYPGVIVVPVMSTGATDGLYLRNGEIPTYGIDGTFGDMDDVRAHGKDERIGVKQFFEGLEFQYHLLKALASQ